ncbi:dipeptidyl carboxypeptidase II [Escherichia coli]|uniref:Dipeptidyl carboxypeptidase II n=1 Tax=Escherichia coli TaxID=562 RepID=A0A2X1PSV0_ECOLX|nr:dipeptidyl carboxypeptidase II [Escherichia coli]
MRDRATREKLFIAGWTRAEKNDANDTRAIIQRLVEIRAQQATLLGFPHYAAWKIADQMAKTPEAALNFMREIVPAARQRASDELASIQAVIDKQQGGFSAQPWDWAFYAEQVRREKFDLDEAQLKPYFELNTVLNEGVFWTANQLFVLSLSNVLIFLSTILTFVCGKFLIIMAWGWRYFTVISSPVIQKAAVHGWAILLSNQRLIKHIR